MALLRNVLIGSACSVAMAAPAAAQSRSFEIPAGAMKAALDLYAKQAGAQLIYQVSDVQSRQTAGVHGTMGPDQALEMILKGSGLTAHRNRFGAIGVSVSSAAATTLSAAEPDRTSAAAPVATNDIIVTAQKREQKIQDVPIAISAFSGKTLDAMKIETGGDLLKSIPNVTFSKNNFAGYNFSIRGIGTKAVSATTDPGVAVAFNSSNLIINRLFEQEFFDIERVEVLRGPQGTLYGRNATAGVVNIISHKADLDKLDGFFKVESGSYLTRRLSGAVNVPIIEDRLAIRAAGAYTKRDGYAVNDYYGNRVDGRDLYSTRFTVSAKPIDPLHLDLIWEHFDEDDDRARTGKQLCHKDDGPSKIGNTALQYIQPIAPDYAGQFSQGCKEGSLYDDAAYSTPNGLSLPAIAAAQSLGLFLEDDLNHPVDPYAGVNQSRNLRHYAAVINPRYHTTANVLEANATLDLGKSTLVSQTLYDRDKYFSTQDYNRYVSNPVFPVRDFDLGEISAGGLYVDPQLGPSNLFLSQDLIRTKARQVSQEIRLQSSDPTSKFQYVVGGNYTNFKYNASYNVYINLLNLLIQEGGGVDGSGIVAAQSGTCAAPGATTVPGTYVPGCIYSDNNPLGVGPEDGHNYFRSINPYRLTSWGAFTDVSYALTPRFKLIAGARLNIDRKHFDEVPSQLLLGTGFIDPGYQFFFGNINLAGVVDRGYPQSGVIKQSWTEPTGRAGFQWTPDLPFTDKTMIYATYSRGYKAGGANPPGPGFGRPDGGFGAQDGTFAVRGQTLATTFKAEYVNSYELGVKNTLLDGRMTLNATGFFYDYKNYQVSQIIDRSSQNENFNATIWGLEFETVFNLSRNLALNANLGYEHSRIGSGQQSLDVMDRTQGTPGYYVVKPFVQLPSNCVVSQAVIDENIKLGGAAPGAAAGFGYAICPGSGFSNTALTDLSNYAPGTTLDQLYPNGGRGFYAELHGNELPNTPHLTFNVGAQYTIPLGNDWGVVVRGDYYRQSGSWARVYNDIGDRLHAWDNANFSIKVGNQALGLALEAYVKNAFNKTPITDAFINSDDTGLTTNVFTLDPRIFGVNVAKSF